MNAADLFIQKPVLRFEPSAVTEKAASAQLDEDPEVWPRQILTELFRTTPEICDYTPRVSMMKVDEEQGYGIGVVIVENTTGSALATTQPSSAPKRVLIPVVIKGHLLCPLDVLMMRSGKMAPLNGHTLREALFRPETFELTTEDWGETSLYSQFYPPGRSSTESGSGSAGSMGGGSHSLGPGMKFSMLEALKPMLLGPDIDAVTKIAQSPEIGLRPGSAFFGALQLLAEAEKTAVRDATGILKQAMAQPPEVLQLGWDDNRGQYWVKQASRRSFMPARTEFLTRGEVLKIAGPEAVSKIDTEGTITIASARDTASFSTDGEPSWEVVQKPGIYRVKTVHGKEQIGWVIPQLIDLDGDVVPMAVFTNGASAMVQDQIVGVMSSKVSPVDLPSGPVKGTGVFYASGPDGVQATVPVQVLGSAEGRDGALVHLVKSLTGEEAKVRRVDKLRSIVAAKGDFHVPATAKFLPLDDESLVALASSPDIAKTSSLEVSPRIELYAATDDEVSLRFTAMPKLANHSPTRMSHDEAAWTLCLAGADSKTAYDIVGHAARGNAVEFRGQDIRLAHEMAASLRKTAAAQSQEVRSLRRSLVKEAATLPDAMTVDAVLSLGFVNSENVRTYISAIPYLQKCLSKICELVLGGRLGLTEIPEHAAARSARALDEVIQGLRALALREIQEGANSGG